MEEKKCNCGPNCTCGCQEGKECTCQDENVNVVVKKKKINKKTA